jgi:thioredoxin-like negative regulator of GroEL
MSDALIESLEAAVATRPDDVALRVHLATLLQAAGRRDDAIRHAAAALERDPTCARRSI